jgi:hypothetical protein
MPPFHTTNALKAASTNVYGTNAGRISASTFGALFSVFSRSPEQTAQHITRRGRLTDHNAPGPASSAGGSCSCTLSAPAGRNRRYMSWLAAYAYRTHTTFVWRNAQLTSPAYSNSSVSSVPKKFITKPRTTAAAQCFPAAASATVPATLSRLGTSV